MSKRKRSLDNDGTICVGCNSLIKDNNGCRCSVCQEEFFCSYCIPYCLGGCEYCGDQLCEKCIITSSCKVCNLDYFCPPCFLKHRGILEKYRKCLVDKQDIIQYVCRTIVFFERLLLKIFTTCDFRLHQKKHMPRKKICDGCHDSIWSSWKCYQCRGKIFCDDCVNHCVECGRGECFDCDTLVQCRECKDTVCQKCVIISNCVCSSKDLCLSCFQMHSKTLEKYGKCLHCFDMQDKIQNVSNTIVVFERILLPFIPLSHTMSR